MASAPSTRSPLRHFLIGDIASQGHRILLPFLTTADRLHLSECSQGLINYRYHLSRVKIIPHPSSSPGMEESLYRLLSGQMLSVVVEAEDEEVTKMVLAVVRSEGISEGCMYF